MIDTTTPPVSTRAVLARGDGTPPRVETVILDPLGPADVLVEIDAAALCRTELLTIDRRRADPNETASPQPTILGHAAVGRVRDVGEGVRRVARGDRVVVTGTRQCGRCFFCVRGAPGACDEIFAYMTRRVGATRDGVGVWTDGGMGTHAERMVFVESNLVVLEDALPAAHAAMLGCGAPSGAGAVLDVARVEAGDSVAVSGCGHVGMWMIQAARAAGAAPVIAIDPDPRRRELALAHGATHALDAGPDVVERVHALTSGRGADVGLEAAGTTLAMEQSFAMTRYGGTVVPTGLESEVAEVRLNNLQYSLGSRTVRGAQCGGGDVLSLVPRLARMLRRGVLDAAAVHTATVPLDRAPAAYRLLDDPAQFTVILSMAESSHP